MDDLPQLYFILDGLSWILGKLFLECMRVDDAQWASLRWIRHTLEITTANMWISKLIDPHFIPTWEYSDDVETCGKWNVKACRYKFQGNQGARRSRTVNTVGIRHAKSAIIYFFVPILQYGSFRVRSTNFLLNLRDPPPISMKFGTLADNAWKKSVQIFSDVGQAVSEIWPSKKWKKGRFLRQNQSVKCQ